MWNLSCSATSSLSRLRIASERTRRRRIGSVDHDGRWSTHAVADDQCEPVIPTSSGTGRLPALGRKPAINDRLETMAAIAVEAACGPRPVSSHLLLARTESSSLERLVAETVHLYSFR